MALNRLSNSSSSENSEEECLNLANRLIRLSRLAFPQVTSLDNMKTDFFIKLFEKICSMRVPDLIESPESDFEKAHNIQAVIDTLSMDVLDLSLVHIAGEDIIAGNTKAIGNLLEVLESYLVYVAGNESPQRLSRTVPEPENIKSRVCKLCGYDPDTDLYHASRKQDKEGVCPVCLFDSSALSGRSSMDSSKTKETPSAIPSSKAATSDGPDGNVSVTRPETSKSGDVSTSRDRVTKDDSKFLPQSPISEDSATSSYSRGKSDLFWSSYLTAAKSKPVSRSNEEVGEDIRVIYKVPQDQNRSRSFDDVHVHIDVNGSESDGAAENITDSFTHQKDDQTPTKSFIKNLQQKFPLRADEEDIAVLYEKNMVKRIASFLDETHHRQKAAQIKRAYLQMLKPHKRKIGSPYRKPRSFLQKDALYMTPKKAHSRSLSKSSSQLGTSKSPLRGEKGLIKELTENFPGIRISPSTVRQMASKYERHLMTMRKKLKDSLSKKSQTQVQTEEATKRQKILADIFNKDIQQSQRMSELEDYKSLERKVKANQRDTRIESARLKHYYDEFYEEMKRRLQKKNYGEEMILKRLFDDALSMQKDQVNTLKKQLRERQYKDAKDHRIYLDALENFYQNQFTMLAKSLAVEKHDMDMRTKAQHRALDMMKREYRSRLETEIRSMQENILRNNEDLHFREMDADRVREDLQDRFNAIFRN